MRNSRQDSTLVRPAPGVVGRADDGAAGVYRRSGLIAERLYLRFTTRELARGFNYYLRVVTLDVMSAVAYADVIG